MSRQYSPYSTTRDGYSGNSYRSGRDSGVGIEDEPRFGSDYPTDRQRRYGDSGPAYGRGTYRSPDYAEDSYSGGHYEADGYDDPDGPDGYGPDGYDADYEYPADYHEKLDRRWIWVAGVAGAILMVAVICTGVILGGGDSGTVTSANSGATTSAAPADDAVTTTAAAPSAAPPLADTNPERVTTVTPTPAATATPEVVPTPVAPAPAAPAPPAPPAAVDPAAAARTITYRVTGNRQLIDLVTIIYTDQQGALQTDVNVALPWTKSVTLNPGVTLSSVTATSVGGQLNCAILDGNGTALALQTNNSMIATCTR
ncbi:hypothetical protein O6072_17840 [Mycolicibacterium neoaurum]|uniref:hypothetical protein n=1 Tax=Mycolicibacterium neoaurum TaxID=1795 RepID=UPI00248CC04D|nr:hypothetical protein [Mycolicibacterium neoaurum]WBP93075.1 hypothetical protein O7W24_18115 [Mycolicibacterium neoaurum]WBS06723.1 hypothetical protein O6072_17840 [Mycolicibacterium neoaurum]